MTMREFETLSVDEQHEQLNKLLQQHHIHGKTIVEIAEYFDKSELTQAQQGVWEAIRRRWKGFGWI